MIARIVYWASLVRNLLCNLGFYEVWLNREVGDEKIFLKIVKQRLHDQFCQIWHEELENSSRALFYRNISDLHFLEYLDFITIRKLRVAFTKLCLTVRLGVRHGL